MGVADAAETGRPDPDATTNTSTFTGDEGAHEKEVNLDTISVPTGRNSSENDREAPAEEAVNVAPAMKEADDADAQPAEIEYITGWKLFSVMFAITLATFLMLLDMAILATAIPRITTQFHSLKDIGWYGSAYNLASAALQPLSGKLYTYFHAKWVFLVCFFIFEVGSLICALATSSPMFIIGRAVAGIGSSGIQNGAFTILAACAPLEKRPSLMGILIGFCQIGLVGGPTIGGALTQYTTWRWCFYLNLPVGALTFACILLVTIPDRRKQPDATHDKFAFSKLDLPGFALFAPFSIMMLLALEYGGNKYAWNSATVIGLFVGGGVLLIIFVLWELREGERAMVPMPVLKKRQIWMSCVASFFLFASMLGAGYFLPVYFQSVKGMTPVRSGVAMLPAIALQLFSGVISGFMIQRVGYYLPFVLVGGAIACVGNGLLSTFSVDTSTATWAGYQAVVGFGRGLLFQAPILAVQAYAAGPKLPLAMATLVFFQTFGGAVFLSIANSIFNNKLKQELVERVPQLDADKIIHAGARGIRDVVPQQFRLEVFKSYAVGFDNVFYAVTAFAGVMFFLSFGMGWKDLRKKKPAKKSDA